MPSLIRAVIFDMDGVLIDAREWHFESLNLALKTFGFEITRDEHFTIYDGLPTAKKLEMLSRKKNLPRELYSEISRLKQQHTMQVIREKCVPQLHLQEMLRRLRAQGLKTAVCSNSIRATVETMMRRAGLISYLDFYLSSQDVQEPKPNPEIYELAIQKLGLTPQECLVVEDNKHGIEAALRAGAHLMTVDSVEDVYFESVSKHMEAQC